MSNGVTLSMIDTDVNGTATLPHPGQGEWWDAFVQDTDRPIVVIHPDGHIVFANERAAEHVGKPSAGDLVGQRIQDVCDGNYAAERLGFVREVAETGTPLAVEGMTCGVMRRTIMKPVNGSDGARHVLMVHTPVRRRNPSLTYEVRRAKVDDYGPLAKLTARELEVLRLIAEGCTTAEIARRLHRSVKTVEWHRVSLGSKLGVSNRVELARIAIRAGLVDLEPAEDSPDEPAMEATSER